MSTRVQLKRIVLKILVSALLMWGVALTVWHAAVLLRTRAGVTLNEGFGGWSVWQYATSHSPYDHTNWEGPFFNFEVHPPLYFWLVGKGMAVTGAAAREAVRCGRLLSVGSTLIVAVVIGWFLAKRGATLWHVLLGVQLFCGAFYTAIIGARLQPDMLGIALAVAGIALIAVRDTAPMLVMGAERGQELTSDLTRRDKHGTMGNGKTVTYA